MLLWPASPVSIPLISCATIATHSAHIPSTKPRCTAFPIKCTSHGGAEWMERLHELGLLLCNWHNAVQTSVCCLMRHRASRRRRRRHPLLHHRREERMSSSPPRKQPSLSSNPSRKGLLLPQ